MLSAKKDQKNLYTSYLKTKEEETKKKNLAELEKSNKSAKGQDNMN